VTVSVAQVTSASPLSAEQQAKLAEQLRRIYGRQLAVHVEIDANLGGGLVVRVGDEVIDGSTAGRVDALPGSSREGRGMSRRSLQTLHTDKNEARAGTTWRS